MLLRFVEMLQWQEQCPKTGKNPKCTYQQVWSPQPISSTDFHEKKGHENPERLPFGIARFPSPDIRIGAFRVDSRQVGNYRLGLAYEKKGDLNAAREALTRALETDDPKCHALQDAWEARARVFQKTNRCKEARGDWERCKQLAADKPAGQRCSAALLGGSC